MNISKPLRAIGILFVATLALSCNLLRGAENNVILPYEVSTGNEPIPTGLTVPNNTPPGTFVTNITSCVEIDHIQGCTPGDIPIKGLPVKVTYSRDGVYPSNRKIGSENVRYIAPKRQVVKNLVTGENGTITDLQELGGVLNMRKITYHDDTNGLTKRAKLLGTREFVYPNFISIFSDAGVSGKCYPLLLFRGVDYFNDPAYENFDIIFEECFPTKRTMTGKERF